jgi:hypothetical protein
MPDGLTAEEAGSLAGEDLETRLVALVTLAGSQVVLPPDELNGAVRRAELLLATGGDPRRALELDGRAVGAFADDLEAPERLAALAAALATLRATAGDRPDVADALDVLGADAAFAWRLFAMTRLAQVLTADE